MLKGQRASLRSSAGARLLVAGLALSSAAFAETSENWRGTVASVLQSLDDAQKAYAGVSGSIAEVQPSERDKAGSALDLIRANVLEAAKSGKVPQDVLRNALIAIDEAQTALRTNSAQTIAWSLATVGQQMKAIDASLSGQPAPTGASQELPNVAGGGSRSQSQAADAKANENQAAQYEQRTGVAPNTPGGPEAAAQNGIALAHSKESPQAATASPGPQNPLANLKREDVVGKSLYDKGGAEVANIEGIKTSPEGKITAVTVNVGGFLGIGARSVQVPAGDLRLNQGRIEAASMTADQIRALPQDSN